MILHLKEGIWPISKRVRYYVECEKCGGTQTATNTKNEQGLILEGLHYVGWNETESGWLCPNHSDRGTTNLNEIFKKTMI